MEWTKLNFGKYIGKTLPQILLSDPDWFFDACETRVFENNQPDLMPEVKDIYSKAPTIANTNDSREEIIHIC